MPINLITYSTSTKSKRNVHKLYCIISGVIIHTYFNDNFAIINCTIKFIQFLKTLKIFKVHYYLHSIFKAVFIKAILFN